MAGWIAVSSQVETRNDPPSNSDKPLTGKAFYFSRSVPSRSAYVKKAESLGGHIVSDERKSDFWIADHTKPGAPKQAISYTYLDAMEQDSTGVHWEDHLIHADNASPGRLRGSSANPPTQVKSRRSAFTIQESKMIWEYMADHERRKTGIANILHFKHLADAMPNHTWQSVQDHYIKKIKPRWSDSAYRQTILSVNDPSQRHLDQLNRKKAISMIQPQPQHPGTGNGMWAPVPGQMQWNQSATALVAPMTSLHRNHNGSVHNTQWDQPATERQKSGQKRTTRVKFSDPVSSDLGPSSPVREDEESESDGNGEADSSLDAIEEESGEIPLPSPHRKRLFELAAELAPPKRQRVEKSDDAEVPNTPDMSPIKDRSSHSPVNGLVAAKLSPSLLNPQVTASAEKAAKVFRDVSAKLLDPIPSSPPIALTPIPKLAPPPPSSLTSTEPEGRRLSQIIEKAVTHAETPPSSPPLAVTSKMPDIRIQDELQDDNTESQANNEPNSQFESQFIPDVTMPDPDFGIEELPLAVPDPDIEMSDIAEPHAQTTDQARKSSPSSHRLKSDRKEVNNGRHQEEHDDVAELDAWIDHQIRKGSSESDVILALKATSMNASLAKIALGSINAGQGLPELIPGIWTREDDLALQGNSTKALKALEKKHGTEYFSERMKFWGEYGRL